MLFQSIETLDVLKSSNTGLSQQIRELLSGQIESSFPDKVIKYVYEIVSEIEG